MLNQITFSDIFTTEIFEKMESVSVLDMAISLILSFIVGLFIMNVYKKTFNGVVFSSGFSLSLIAMSMISTLAILAVTSNIVLSLGMVGALSIVRFRSAVKEPMDIAYLFWSISTGIVLGAGLIPLALIGSAFIGILMLVSSNIKSYDNPYMAVLSLEDEDAEKLSLEVLKKNTKKHLVKSKSVSKDGEIELSVEIRLNEMETSFVNELQKIKGVSKALLVSFNGEYSSWLDVIIWK